MRSTWQRYDTLATNGDSDAGSTSGARLHPLCLYPPAPRHITPLITWRLFANAAVGLPAGNSMPYSCSHSLYSASEVVATTASANVSDVVEMIRIKAGLRIQNAAMKVQWYGLLPALYLSPRHSSLLTASTGSTGRGAAHP
jgi:hypothetical protein